MKPQTVFSIATIFLTSFVLQTGFVPAEAKGYLKLGNGEGRIGENSPGENLKIVSWKWGDLALDEGPKGRQFRPLVITREVDEGTPLLFVALSRRKTFPEVEVALPVGQDFENRYLKYKLKDVRLISISVKTPEGSKETPAEETIELKYEEVEVLD